MSSTSSKRRARQGRAKVAAAAATAAAVLALWLLSGTPLSGYGAASSLHLARQSAAARDCPLPIQAAADGLSVRLPVLPDACATRRCASCLAPGLQQLLPMPASGVAGTGIAAAKVAGEPDPANPLGFQGMGEVREDEFLWEHFFYGQANGTFLEMGAVDGVHLSNSLWFARRAGWRGLLIEALPDFYTSLTKRRPESTCVNAAVCAQRRNVTYLQHKQGPGVSGILEFMAPSFLERWYPEQQNQSSGGGQQDGCGSGVVRSLKESSGALESKRRRPLQLEQQCRRWTAAHSEQQGRRRRRQQWQRRLTASTGGAVENSSKLHRQNIRASWSLPCLPLQQILDAVGMAWFDFLSLDVEGAELEVLRTLDWRHTHFSVILVELRGDDQDKDRDVVSLLLSPAAAYRLYARDSRNAFFVRRGFQPSAKPGVHPPAQV